MDNFSFIRRLSRLTTILTTRFCGVEVGHDEFGNYYYRAKSTPQGLREKRWVIYAGEPEASKVPPDWYGWLHHMAENPLQAGDAFHKPWIKPHEENLTGTDQAYFPPGYAGGQRPKATGDYQAWQPE